MSDAENDELQGWDEENKEWYDRSYWTTREGQKLYPRQFEDSHLENTIKFIERNARRYQDALVLEAYLAVQYFNGDMAQLAVEQEADGMAMLTPQQFLEYHVPIYNALVAEKKRRAESEQLENAKSD